MAKEARLARWGMDAGVGKGRQGQELTVHVPLVLVLNEGVAPGLSGPLAVDHVDLGSRLGSDQNAPTHHTARPSRAGVPEGLAQSLKEAPRSPGRDVRAEVRQVLPPMVSSGSGVTRLPGN